MAGDAASGPDDGTVAGAADDASKSAGDASKSADEDDENSAADDTSWSGGETDEDDTAGDASESGDEQTPPSDDPFVPDEDAEAPDTDRRQVAVPPSLFRIVVVFSTLLSIVSVVAGFSLLNAAATVVRNPPASLFVSLVSLATGRSPAGLAPYHDAIALAVAIAGVAAIGVGVWVYAVGTRFRAADENA